MRIANWLKDWRKSQHWGQRKLAAELNTAQFSVHRYETGKQIPDDATLYKIWELVHLRASGQVGVEVPSFETLATWRALDVVERQGLKPAELPVEADEAV